MNFEPLRTVLFEKRLPQNLPFVKNMAGYGKRKSPAAKP